MPDTSLLRGRLLLGGRLDARFFALLRAVQGTGSLHKAARAAGYSYKGAWLLIDAAAALARQPLLGSATGGAGGGGTRLTAAGAALLAAWETLDERHDRFLHEQEGWLLAQPALAAVLRRIAMKTSARNQFAGRIAAVQPGPVTSEVTLDIGQGLAVTAAITSASCERIGAVPGADAVALVKASDVLLVLDFAGYRLSARNQLAGTIARLDAGPATALVGLVLPGGATLTASVTRDAVDSLGLAVGQRATAAFKAGAVLLAVADA